MIRAVDWLLPGLGHLRHGFRREATKYLLFVGLWLAVVVFFSGRLRDMTAELTGPRAAENWVALVFLAVWPVAWMGAARRGLRRLLHPPEHGILSQWQIAIGLMRRNTRAVLGLRILGVAYMVAFLCPVLAPKPPESA